MLDAPRDADHGPWGYAEKKLVVVTHLWEMKLVIMAQSEDDGLTVTSNGFALGPFDQQQMTRWTSRTWIAEWYLDE
ncbi:Protein transport protein [Venturia inaequalis]|nr:Protein transport protein [Venturia inaequalis]